MLLLYWFTNFNVVKQIINLNIKIKKLLSNDIFFNLYKIIQA